MEFFYAHRHPKEVSKADGCADREYERGNGRMESGMTEKRMMEKASFAEICRMMRDRKGEAVECMKGVFEVALLFLPGFMCKEAAFITNVANGVSLLGAKAAVGKSIDHFIRVFGKGDYTDFTSKYEHAQAAQVLMVFAAYFDSMRLYLPDGEGRIEVTPGEKLALAEQAVKGYADFLLEKSGKKAGEDTKDILERDLPMPDPVESLDAYLQNLKYFYDSLNREFLLFYEKLFFWERMDGIQRESFMGAIRELPRRALENYKKQYYQLAVTFHDFFVWTSMQEHREIRQRIDIGFEALEKWICTYHETSGNAKALRTLESYGRKYKGYVEGTVIDTPEMDYGTLGHLVLPKKKDIFVPQGFRALTYRSSMQLENPEVWSRCREREGIGKFISDILRHPVTGALPLLVLGHPGAGKSLLCHMLAARILSHEYHVIIVKLRDTVADQTVPQQINQQMERDFANGCTWSELVESGLRKPFLVIFDGYDELLQASGKTYADYLQRIAEFQKQQGDIYGIFVKCIVTSRVTLIDKALIVDRTPVVMLADFHPPKIQRWCQIWNKKNEEYFSRDGVEPFRLEDTDKIFELAKQPLLLLMLALYDANGNALKKDRELNGTQLYDRLIREFILREKRKEESFRRLQAKAQEKTIDREMTKVSIAALGMYNRKVLYIHSEELEKDLGFILQAGDGRKEREECELPESDKLLGSFFFIHRSDAVQMEERKTVRNAAYEFLHNTFGEFLTANYIVEELYHVLDWIKMLLQGNRQEQWNMGTQRAWVACLVYAPLFSRPVVVQMLHEWSVSYFDAKNADREETEEAFDFLVEKGIRDAAGGEAVFALKEVVDGKGNPYAQEEILKHLAVFSMNLLILRTVVCRSRYGFRFDGDTWKKLRCLWRYGFSEDELAGYAQLFRMEKRGEVCTLLYVKSGWKDFAAEERTDRLLDISRAIGDEVSYGLLCALKGKGFRDGITEILSRNDLREEHRFWWNFGLENLSTPNGKLFWEFGIFGVLEGLWESCQREGDTAYLFGFYTLLHYSLKVKKIGRTKREMAVIMEWVIQGMEFQEGLPVMESDMEEYISDLAVDLLDYIPLKTNDLIRLCKVYSQCTYRGPYGYEYGMKYVLRMYNRIMEKGIAFGNGFGESAGMEYIKNGLNRIIAESREKEVNSAEIVFEMFGIAYHFLLAGNRQDSETIFEECREAFERGGLPVNTRITVTHKIIVIRYLYMAFRESVLDFQDVAWACTYVIGFVDIRKVFEESGEAAEKLCYLLDVYRFMKYGDVRKGILWIAEKHGKEISVGLYGELYRLAKNNGDTETVSKLDRLV